MGWMCGYKYDSKEEMVQHVINNYSNCQLIERSKNGEWLLMRGMANYGVEIYAIIRVYIAYDRKKKSYGYKDVAFECGIDINGLPKEWLEKYHTELDLNNTVRYHYPYKFGQLLYNDNSTVDLFAA